MALRIDWLNLICDHVQSLNLSKSEDKKYECAFKTVFMLEESERQISIEQLLA